MLSDPDGPIGHQMWGDLSAGEVNVSLDKLHLCRDLFEGAVVSDNSEDAGFSNQVLLNQPSEEYLQSSSLREERAPESRRFRGGEPMRQDAGNREVSDVQMSRARFM